MNTRIVARRSLNAIDPTFVFKLLTAPALTAFATLLARRFGQSIAGWLVGFPLTSAPVSLFLAIEHGNDFAAQAAIGSIASALASGIFALAYAHTAGRGWIVATAVGSVFWAATGLSLGRVSFTPLLLTILAWAVFAIAGRLMPRTRDIAVTRAPSSWDLPARMLVATALVLGVTSAAPILGPFTSGLVTAYPLYATVLAVFAQRASGPAAGIAVMRGLLLGAFAFVAFFLVIAAELPSLGIVTAFVVATLAVLAVQGVALVLLRRGTAEARA